MKVLCAVAALAVALAAVPAGGASTPPRAGLLGMHERVLEPPRPPPDAAPVRTARASAAEPQKYAFYPQAGTLWEDVFVVNYVDLDESKGIEDWACGNYTYNGHLGHDTDIKSFKVQDLGVPVFAALDGRVVYAHDGEKDKNVAWSNAPSNAVELDHGDGHETLYYHLKKGSVAVALGETVRAGTQIGMVGSSGVSTWPHLHFESHLDGVAFEPSAGPCRPGPSLWVDQVDIPPGPLVEEVVVSAEPFRGRAALPWDEWDRTGVLLAGDDRLYVRVSMSGIPPRAEHAFSLVAPDGRRKRLFTDRFRNDEVMRAEWFWWFFDWDLTPGRWELRMSVNGSRVLRAPFEVVRRSSEIVNRRPKRARVVVETTGDGPDDALVCRVTGPTLIRDRDYDIVRYDYTWTVDGAVARSIRSAALSDMLPAGTAGPESAVSCEVTPSDGRAAARPTTATLD